MKDKELFDKQISSIRARYNNLCQPKAKGSPIVSPFDCSQLCSPHNQNYIFNTPAKHNRDGQNQNSISFSKLPSPQKNQLECPETTTTLLQRQKKDIIMKDDYRNRGYLTSRDNSVTKKGLSLRQKELTKRIEENQRLLSVSKQLRQGTSRGATAQKNQRSENKQDLLSKKRQSSYANRMRKQLDMKVLQQCKQNMSRRGALTERQFKPSSYSKDFKVTVEESHINAHTAFNDKMNEILKTFKTRTSSQSKQQSVTRTIEHKQKTYMTPSINYIQMKMTQGKQVGKRDDLKVVSVFQNTTNIQDRIKAILSYH